MKYWAETNAEKFLHWVYVVILKQKHWQNALPETRFDNSGLMTITEKQERMWNSFQGDRESGLFWLLSESIEKD